MEKVYYIDTISIVNVYQFAINIEFCCINLDTWGGIDMYLGVDYYPEHWDKNMIDEDLNNIIELNCNVIRIGEFAWHMMESIEGNFDFSYFDMVIEKAKQKGLKIIFGTLTHTMQAWLSKKYTYRI